MQVIVNNIAVYCIVITRLSKKYSTKVECRWWGAAFFITCSTIDILVLILHALWRAGSSISAKDLSLTKLSVTETFTI